MVSARHQSHGGVTLGPFQAWLCLALGAASSWALAAARKYGPGWRHPLLSRPVHYPAYVLAAAIALLFALHWALPLHCGRPRSLILPVLTLAARPWASGGSPHARLHRCHGRGPCAGCRARVSQGALLFCRQRRWFPDRAPGAMAASFYGVFRGGGGVALPAQMPLCQ